MGTAVTARKAVVVASCPLESPSRSWALRQYRLVRGDRKKQDLCQLWEYIKCIVSLAHREITRSMRARRSAAAVCGGCFPNRTRLLWRIAKPISMLRAIMLAL